MTIDAQLPPNQMTFTPVRPDPVPPGRDTQRPVPTPNGAEAGARNPLQDQQRGKEPTEDSRARSQQTEQQNAARAGNRAGIAPELTEAQKRQLDQLKARDREVRAHEAAHKSAAGSVARGSASFDYQTGPDGNRYAVGGEVSIDSGRTGDPQKDLAKAQTIRRAALAPATPSAQDRRVAAQAAVIEAEAQQELRDQDETVPRAAAEESKAPLTSEAAEPESESIEASAQSANDAFHPNSPNRDIPSTVPDRVGELLDVFA